MPKCSSSINLDPICLDKLFFAFVCLRCTRSLQPNCGPHIRSRCKYGALRSSGRHVQGLGAEWGPGSGCRYRLRPPEGKRFDGSGIASTRYPSSTLGAFPRAEPVCPVPDFVVVHFPEYMGPACFDDLPKTWVPVPCAKCLCAWRGPSPFISRRA